jgi:hypothetical protein
MSKSQSFNSDLDIDIEDAFSFEIERAIILLNRLVMTDIDLKSE